MLSYLLLAVLLVVDLDYCTQLESRQVVVDSLPAVVERFVASSIPSVSSFHCDYPVEVLGELECIWVVGHDEIPARSVELAWPLAVPPNP